MIKRHDEKLNGPLLFDLIHNVIEAYNSTVTPNIENDAICGTETIQLVF